MSAADVLITPVSVWVSSVGVARPYEDVAFGVSWPNWRNVGFTATPLTVNLEREKTQKMVEQATTKIGQAVTSETLTLETSLAELIMQNLALVWPGFVTVQEAAAGQVPYEKLQGGGKICVDTLQWGFEGEYRDEECAASYPLRFFCIGEAEMGGQLEFGKTAQTGVPLRVEGSYDFAQPPGKRLYEWLKVTGEAL